MLTPLICGAFTHSGDEDDDQDITPSCIGPRRSRKHRNKNNPYSSLGLDKFSNLLSELEAKKKEIYSQNDPQDISLVRFICKGSDPEPVVIKVRQDHQNSVVKLQSFGHSKQEASSSKKPKKIKWSTNALLVIILILVCLAVLGRSGATVIMAIGWYLIPLASKKNVKNDKQISKEIGTKIKGSKSNKDYMRKLSENCTMVRGQNWEKRGHAHRKSW